MMLFSVFIVFIVCAVPFQVIQIYYLFTQGNPGYKVVCLNLIFALLGIMFFIRQFYVGGSQLVVVLCMG